MDFASLFNDRERDFARSIFYFYLCLVIIIKTWNVMFSDEPRARKIKRIALPKAVFPKEELYSWLIQPTALTFMRHDYSLMQQRIYATIIDRLQEAFIEEKNSVFNHAYKENSLFYKNSWSDYERDFKEDDIKWDRMSRAVPIKIMMKDFNIPKTQYQDLKDSLVEFGFSPVAIKIQGINGKLWVEYSSLCKMRIPVMLKKTTHVYAVFDRTVAIEMFRAMHAGYTKFMKDVILYTRCKYTSRIYLFLSAYTNRRSCFIPLEDLRKYLRLSVEYKDYRKFKEKILDKASVELRTLYDSAISNICFDFSPEYTISPTTAQKTVTGISFTIKRSDNVKEIEVPYFDDVRKRNVNNLLMEYCGCSSDSAQSIADKVTDNNYPHVIEKISSLAKRFDQDSAKIYVREAYTMKTFENFFATVGVAI